MSLGDFGFTVSYVGIGIFLGYVLGFFYGQTVGRRTGKIEGWINGYKELIRHLKAKISLDQEFSKDKKQKILVIEDNEDARHILVSVLKLYGFKVFDAGCGRDGLKIAIEECPDVAIIDIILPDISGHEIIKTIRRNKAVSKMRLIALTGNSLEDDRLKAIDAGCDIYITKPYDFQKLISSF